MSRNLFASAKTFSGALLSLLTVIYASRVAAVPLAAPQPRASALETTEVSAGFSAQANDLSPALREAWNSTFLFTFKGSPSVGSQSSFGSAFVVDIKAAPHGFDVYMLTNYHVMEGDCSPKGRCNSAAVRRGLGWDPKQQEYISQGNDVLLMDEIEVIKVSRSPDLALFKARLTPEWMRGRTLGQLRLKPLKIRSQCENIRGEQVWAIGHPATGVREKPESTIRDPKKVLKRWSKGIVLYQQITNYRHGDVQPFLLTTIDLLGGNSGGPMLDANGEVVGVMTLSRSHKEDGYRYEGDETPGAERYHSGAVPCSVIQAFLKGSL